MTFTLTNPQTLRSHVSRSGIGLHSGDQTTVRLRPAPPGTGRIFVRVDRADRPQIPASIVAVSQTQLSTELIAPNPESATPEPERARVRTVEHLLAALAAAGIRDVRIEIDGAEVPLLDGSAREWCEAIEQAGYEPVRDGDRHCQPVATTIDKPISVQQGDASVTALPSPELRFSYGIAFDDAAIGEQWHSWSPEPSSLIPHPAQPSTILQQFAQAIGNARTFGLARQVEHLQAAGLIRGGSLENALVCEGDRWLNPPLRFANEPVRHKILDLVGDLSLLGAIPRAHYVAYKASHALHVALARAISSREL
jgi:UDP-3-O-[3-hydroxymyristoyl] N-acetylglucosamine deacetylase